MDRCAHLFNVGPTIYPKIVHYHACENYKEANIYREGKLLSWFRLLIVTL